jgi:hypothetical protein
VAAGAPPLDELLLLDEAAPLDDEPLLEEVLLAPPDDELLLEEALLEPLEDELPLAEALPLLLDELLLDDEVLEAAGSPEPPQAVSIAAISSRSARGWNPAIPLLGRLDILSMHRISNGTVTYHRRAVRKPCRLSPTA